MNNLVVLKFGGSSMGDAITARDNLPNVIKIIKQQQKQYKNVIVVCSAFAGETRRLDSIAARLNFNDKERDNTLAQGEIFSSYVLGNFLSSRNINNVVMNGDNLPVKTSGQYGKSNIESIDVKYINSELEKNNVVIVPGFIGKNSSNNLTTIGFDGSDTSAITIADWMKADKVCLFKDVDGIYSANPKKTPAQKHNSISADDMYYYSLLGARIVHPNAVKVALKSNFAIHIMPTFSNGEGSIISNNVEDKDIVGVTYFENHKGDLALSVVGKAVKNTEDNLFNKLRENNIDVVVDKEQKSKKAISFILNNKDSLDSAIKIAHSFYNLKENSAIKPLNQIYYDPSRK